MEPIPLGDYLCAIELARPKGQEAGVWLIESDSCAGLHRHAELLGTVRWYRQYCRYVFDPESVPFDNTCLREIAAFLERCCDKHAAATKGVSDDH